MAQRRKMLTKLWKQELRLEGFTLKYRVPEHFTRCHWQKEERVLPLWIAYRAFMAFYFVFSFLYTITPIDRAIPKEDHEKYLIFLTHWTYIMEVFYFCLAFAIVVERAVKEHRSFPQQSMLKMPWHYQTQWVIFTVTLPSSFVVSIIFWMSVYDPKLSPARITTFIEHLFNSIFLAMDFCLVAHPVKFLHFYWPMAYGFLYIIFTVVYQLSGGQGVKGIVPIYKILDWRNPGSAVLTCFGCNLLVLFFYCLFCTLSIFKFSIKGKSNSPEEGTRHAVSPEAN